MPTCRHNDPPSCHEVTGRKDIWPLQCSLSLQTRYNKDHAWPPNTHDIEETMNRKLIVGFMLTIAATLVSGFFVPRTNPPISYTPKWDTEETRLQFIASCADCHSHETKWPWYSYIGPSAFLVWSNVEEGREHFNISVRKMGEADDAGEEVLEGSMPPKDYLLLHRDAGLAESQKKAFAKGLTATFGKESYRKKSKKHDD